MKPKNRLIQWIIVFGIIITALTVLMLPFIIEKIYYIKPPFDFLYLSYDARDILSYYGGLLSFIGTIILGALTLHQNKIAQEKTQEVNQLLLEFQRKNMIMAEQQFKMAQDEKQIIPKFEIAIGGYNGNYANLHLRMKNVSPIIVSDLSPIEMIASKNGNTIASTSEMKIGNRSLSPAQSTKLETRFPSLVKVNGRNISYYTDIKLSISFSCEDERGNVHYFRAAVLIPSTKDFNNELWDVEKVG